MGSILIIDDNKPNKKIISFILDKHGYGGFDYNWTLRNF